MKNSEKQNAQSHRSKDSSREKRKTDVRRLTTDAVLASAALILSYIEFLLPPISTAFPGIKMGLPNMAIICALFLFGWKDAIAVSLVRLCMTAILFGNPLSFSYSVAGAALSLGIMILLRKVNRFSTVGVSIAGGVFHNVGQILVAMFVFATVGIAYYLIVLSVTGTIAGALVGLASGYLLKIVKKFDTSQQKS